MPRQRSIAPRDPCAARLQGTLARSGRRYLQALSGLLLALALATALALRIGPLLEPGAASAATALVPAHDRSLSGVTLERSSPPRDEE